MFFVKFASLKKYTVTINENSSKSVVLSNNLMMPIAIWEHIFNIVIVPPFTILYCIVLYIFLKYPNDFKNSYLHSL